MQTIFIKALLNIALVTTCTAQPLIVFRLVHPQNSTLTQDALRGHSNEYAGYEAIAVNCASDTNYYWVNKRPIISEEHLARVGWHTNDDFGVSVTFTLTQQGYKHLAYATRNNTNKQLALFADDSFMMIVPINLAVTSNQIVARNIFSTDEAEELKQLIDKKAEHSPPAGRGEAPRP
jgi:preprotein translocase subunit SecD